MNSRRVQPDGIHVSISSTAAAYLFKRRRTSSSRSTQRRRGAEAGCRGGAPRRRAEAAGRGGVPRRRAAHRGGTGRGRGCCSCGGEPAVVARRHGCSGPARRRWHDRTRANALSSLAVAHSRVPRPARACWPPFPYRGRTVTHAPRAARLKIEEVRIVQLGLHTWMQGSLGCLECVWT